MLWTNLPRPHLAPSSIPSCSASTPTSSRCATTCCHACPHRLRTGAGGCLSWERQTMPPQTQRAVLTLSSASCSTRPWLASLCNRPPPRKTNQEMAISPSFPNSCPIRRVALSSLAISSNPRWVFTVIVQRHIQCLIRRLSPCQFAFLFFMKISISKKSRLLTLSSGDSSNNQCLFDPPICSVMAFKEEAVMASKVSKPMPSQISLA